MLLAASVWECSEWMSEEWDEGVTQYLSMLQLHGCIYNMYETLCHGKKIYILFYAPFTKVHYTLMLDFGIFKKDFKMGCSYVVLLCMLMGWPYGFRLSFWSASLIFIFLLLLHFSNLSSNEAEVHEYKALTSLLWQCYNMWRLFVFVYY